jgi:hypothetical protein
MVWDIYGERKKRVDKRERQTGRRERAMGELVKRENFPARWKSQHLG